MNTKNSLRFFVGVYLAFFGSLDCFATYPHKGTLSSVNLGARFSSILQRRGVILYRDFQIDPVVSVFLFDDKLEFLGDSIGYRDFVYGDSIRLRTRLVSITDKPLFPAYSSIREAGPRRDDTYESTNSVEFFFPGYNDHFLAELDLNYSKDIYKHWGNYFEARAKVKLAEFNCNWIKKRIEPNLVVSAGVGDPAHNQYLYGPSASGNDVSNTSYGIWLAFPDDADRFYPIVQLMHFAVEGQNRGAEFARDRNEGFLFSFIATAGILD